MNRAARRVLLSLMMLSAAVPAARADVQPGDLIDQTNWEKIEGLVPDFILLWVKAGDLPLKIGKLSYDPTRFWSREVLDHWQENVRRYTVDENHGIVDKATGKPVRGIKGLPFPEPDPGHSRLPMMLLWNIQFVQYFLPGNLREMQFWLSYTRKSLEKTVQLENLQLILDPAKSRYDYGQISVFRSPFNLAGIGSLALYCLYPLHDGLRYAYAPELRRMKRLSHRIHGSDVQFGFDQAPDDSWVGGPKTNMEEGEYRYLGERDALVPYFSEDPLLLDWSPKGDLKLGYAGSGMEILTGQETPGWKGAIWHFTNVIWVKSRVYVFESRSREPGYAYGPCEGWVEKGTFSSCYKRITDPGGNLWKGLYSPARGTGSKDGKVRMIDNLGSVEVDMRRDHGSAYPLSYRKGGYKEMQVKDLDENLFTEGGFSRYSR